MIRFIQCVLGVVGRGLDDFEVLLIILILGCWLLIEVWRTDSLNEHIGGFD